MKKGTIDSEKQHSVNSLPGEGRIEETQQSLKKSIVSEKEEKTKDTAEVLGGLRSSEAIKLAEQSNGKIILRPDGKIDFPELGIIGMGRLSVKGPTDLENGLVQGNTVVDQYKQRGVSGISYMTGVRAMKEVKNQGKKLLPANRAEEKINALLATLGCNGAEQSKALQALFGGDFSGYWNPHHKEWQYVGSKEWKNVGSTKYGVSEVYNENVSTITFHSSNAYEVLSTRSYPIPFLAFEDC